MCVEGKSKKGNGKHRPYIGARHNSQPAGRISSTSTVTLSSNGKRTSNDSYDVSPKSQDQAQFVFSNTKAHASIQQLSLSLYRRKGFRSTPS